MCDIVLQNGKFFMANILGAKKDSDTALVTALTVSQSNHNPLSGYSIQRLSITAQHGNAASLISSAPDAFSVNHIFHFFTCDIIYAIARIC